MGAIQDSINSMISTTAAGIGAAKHFVAQNEDRVAAAKEKGIAAAEEMPALKKQVESAKEGVKKVESDASILEELGSNPAAIKGPEDLKALEELSNEVLEDKKMADLALTTAEAKIKVRKEMITRIAKTIDSKGVR